MDARTVQLALEEIRHIEASLDRARTDIKDIGVIMDRIIANTQRSLASLAESAGAASNTI